jgi:solute:Na+ symporter, SSS family
VRSDSDRFQRAWSIPIGRALQTPWLFLAFCVLLAALPAFCCAQAASAPSSQLRWEELPAIPERLGLGGPVVGVHGDALIVAGGANFPDGPPWSVAGQPPGKKVWHDQIWVLLPGAESWLSAGQLPYPLAYAATVSTADGVYVLGGETFADGNFPMAECLRLSWESESRQVVVQRNALPPLLEPCHYHAAALSENTVYVAASHPASEASPQLDQAHFWSLDLSATSNLRRWTSLDAWPGKPREKMALIAQTSGALNDYGSATALYLVSGSNWFRDGQGQADLSRYEHYHDVFRYIPQTNQWTEVASVSGGGRAPAMEPSVKPVVAAAAIAVGQSHILVFSGSTGGHITAPLDTQPEFAGEVLAYHTITDTWSVAGEMPQGVVTTAAVMWKGKLVIPSGEIRPGVRTPRVQTAILQAPAARFGTLNMIVVGMYLAILMLIGWWCARRGTGTEDFFLAGRRMPWWAAGLSIYATQLSAITFLSLPAVAFASNWLAFPAQVMILAFVPIVVTCYLPYFRRLNLTTAYQYLERRFSPAVRYYGSLSFVVFQLGRMAVVVYLPALALATATGVNVSLCILLMGCLATIYTVMGGMEAVIWTDVSQVIVLWGGLFLTLALAISGAGGWGELWTMAWRYNKLTVINWGWEPSQMATWLIIVGSFALQFGPYTTDQSVVQRYMTTKDERAAARGIWLNGILSVPFSLLFFMLGTSLYGFFKLQPELLQIGMENDRVFPLFMTTQLPAGLSGIVIAGIFAASMSSLDSSMHSISTVLTTDYTTLFAKGLSDARRLALARGITVAVGVLGTGLAIVLAGWDIRSSFFFFQKLLGLLSSGLAAVFILGIFTRRTNSGGALTGALASFLLMYYVVFWTSINFYLYAVVGIGSGVIVGYLTSLCFAPPTVDKVEIPDAGYDGV